MSQIISHDITQPIHIPQIDGNRLSSRDSLVLRAFKNDVWLPNTTVAEQKHCLVSRELLFQILIVEDISKSKLSQIEDITARLNPNNQRIDRLSSGREKIVINQVNVESEETNIETSSPPNKKTVYRLTLQDKSGAIFFALNVTNLPWLSVCMLGSKLIISMGTQFIRGVFLLNDTNCIFLGGVNQTWNENRELKLQDYLESKLQRESESQLSSNTKKRKATQ
ncbi:hypothetical protein HG536_0H01650 [Torulaspora globosa]|uniref:RecQ mediated genome instability protein 1 OB-fold domain-containing protein n=1 Tax=Torulaspora globosa TaxID=48254 RepID=A0A7G3ZMQ4_9SACH|nr:uncharacterized protein HG536_0H01650 [Torulaspora globosa]QLL34790.1 hypothetical protein HG536_0H01650 [Torulaspora globosa]